MSYLSFATILLVLEKPTSTPVEKQTSTCTLSPVTMAPTTSSLVVSQPLPPTERLRRSI